MEYLVLQSFAARGNRAVSRFFGAVTSNPWYPGYKTSIVAPEPFVERVAGDVHSIGGRIGTHMSLQVLSRDLVVRPWPKASMVMARNPTV
jgi:hypothetical protein